jgi:hypothetical protein
MAFKAIKLTPKTVRHLMAIEIPDDLRGDFAYACLTTAYEGETWYLIRDTDNEYVVDFIYMIVTQDTLRATYAYKKPARSSWFGLTPKQ